MASGSKTPAQVRTFKVAFTSKGVPQTLKIDAPDRDGAQGLLELWADDNDVEFSDVSVELSRRRKAN